MSPQGDVCESSCAPSLYMNVAVTAQKAPLILLHNYASNKYASTCTCSLRTYLLDSTPVALVKKNSSLLCTHAHVCSNSTSMHPVHKLPGDVTDKYTMHSIYYLAFCYVYAV